MTWTPRTVGVALFVATVAAVNAPIVSITVHAPRVWPGTIIGFVMSAGLTLTALGKRP